MKKLSLTIIEKIEGLKSLYLCGKYHEVLNDIKGLVMKDYEEKNVVDLLILQSRCLYRLRVFEWEPKYNDEGYKKINEAYVRSKKLNDIDLIFDSLYTKIWYTSLKDKHDEVMMLFDEATSVLDEIEIMFPESYDFRKAMLLSLAELKQYNIQKLDKKINSDYNQLVKIFNEALSLATKNKIPEDPLSKELPLFLLGSLGIFHNINNDYEKALYYFNQALEVVDKIGNEHWRSELFYRIAMMSWIKGDYDSFLDYATKSMEIRKEIGNVRGYGRSCGDLGIYYCEIGEYKKALEQFQKAYNILSEDGKREDDFYHLDNIGVAYFYLGEVDKSLEYYQKSHKILLKIGNEYGVYHILGNIAGTYQLQGKLDKSLKIQEERVDYYKKKGYKVELSQALYCIHLVYRDKGQVNKALEILKKSLTIRKKIGNPFHIVSTLYELIKFTSKNNWKEIAEQYFEELKVVMKDIKHEKTKRYLLLTEGLILKNSAEIRERIRAEVLFDTLLQEDLNYHLLVEILFNLCDLLLSDLKRTGDEKTLNKLQNHIDTLIQTSTKNNIYQLKIESLWFKAQLSILDGKFEDAQQLLSQSLALAEDKGYNMLIVKINNSKDDAIKRIIDLEKEAVSLSIQDKMGILKLENGFKAIKEAKVFDASDLQLKQHV